MNKIELKKINLPDKPGVYIFKTGRKILYIGKATSLKDRVRSYFSNDLLKTRGLLIIDMVTESTKVDFIETDSVLEALILEADLIKKYKPIANTKEKDNRSYNFVCITKEDFPRVLIERGRTLDFDKFKNKYQSVYGPFPSQHQLREALKIIRKIFPFQTQKNKSTKSKNSSYSSIYKEIGLEPDLSNKEAQKIYKKNIRHIKLFLSGKKKEIIKLLEKDMRSFVKKQEFENATKARNKIFALKHIQDVSLIDDENLRKVSDNLDFRIEAYDIAHMSGKNSVGVMTVIENNEVKKSDYRKFILRETKRGDDVGGLKEILIRRLKHTEWPLPDIFVIDGGIAQRNMAIETIHKENKLKTPIVNVVKNEKHKPQNLLGSEKLIKENKKNILLANNEAHRFAIEFYRSKQRKTSLGKK